MSWRFRKSFSPIPGIRVTVSPSGISTSVGVGPLRPSAGPRGAAVTAGIPGTGLSFRETLGTPPGPRASNVPAHPPVGLDVPVPAPVQDLPMQAIRSAESLTLTSAGLAAFKQALEQAERQFAEIDRELDNARLAEAVAVGLHSRWSRGWFLRRIMKQRFAEITLRAEEATARRSELQQQLDLSRLPTQFEMSDEPARAYEGLRSAFAALARAQRIWDNVAHRATNKVVERTTASRIVDLKPVRFELSKCPVIDALENVPRMENSNGGDLFFYPGFLLYHAAARNYALVEYGDVDLAVRRTSFHEEAAVPGDARQIGTTWAKANKDGSPDLRFKDNYPIPVMQYATLTLRTQAGLNEEYLVSNVETTEAFLSAWIALRQPSP